MKLRIENSDRKFTLAGLDIGEVFKIEDQIFLLTDETDSQDTTLCRCVDLVSGVIVYLSKNAEISLMDATLLIRAPGGAES